MRTKKVAGSLYSPHHSKGFAVASATILADAATERLAKARQDAERQAELDAYASFRSVIDGYAEDARPSVHDVESVLTVVKDAMAVNAGQIEYQTAASTSRDHQWVFAPVKFRSASKRPVKLTALEMSGVGLTEGRTWYLRLSPGVMGLRCADENKKEKARERQKERERKEAELSVAACDSCPEDACTGHGGAAGEIVEWSARSRARLSELVGSLDYSDWLQTDGALAMVTLTLPAWWQAVAPDGATFKKLLKRFELRWRRNVGPWRLLWKLEFQGRGAPHWHALMRVPALVGNKTFEEWVAQTWADCVGASKELDRCNLKTRELSSEYSRHLAAHANGHCIDFSGKDFSDPRRISLYFLGHSAKTTDGKEYQHKVPAEWREPGKGPGRFWGYPGLVSASREIELTERDAVQAARVLRKVKRARAWTVKVIRERGKLPEGERHKHRTFGVEVRAKEGQKQGRAARRTAMRRAWHEAQESGKDWAWSPRFTPSSLGAGGYAVGGWVLVNDALQLGVDLARYFDARRSGAVG